MNTQHILEVAGRYISDIQALQPNIFKGTLRVANKAAGVYYFDLSNQQLKDFDSYQEKLLADEFYSQPGNLQWNYYLFMVNDRLEPNSKELIEKNDKYARKYVLTEAEFNDFFSLEKSDAEIRPNIVAEWKRRLDDAGLADVYSNKTYVDVVKQFKEMTTIVSTSAPRVRSTDDQDKIRFINRILLKDGFRPHPIMRRFEFGKVNLFRGINGVGKTSLFEAIEAMICGRCLRNPHVVMPPGSIHAEFNHSGEFVQYGSISSRQYIERDQRWYATSGRTNSLYHSFNRFNFFNADAAYNFSMAATEKEVSEALFYIVLGPEYKFISERTVGILERLRPEFNHLKKEMDEALQREQRSVTIMQQYKEPASLAQMREAISATYQTLGFKNTRADEDLSIIETRHNELRSILKILLDDDSSVQSLADFDTVFLSFQKKQKAMTEMEELLREQTAKQTDLVAEGKRLNLQYDFLIKSFAYIQDEQLMKLEGLLARQGVVNLLSSKISIVQDLISDITVDSFAISTEEQALNTDIEELSAKLKTSEGEMNELVKSIGELESVMRQIRSHGQDFLKLDHDATDCPLCHWSFSYRNELEQRIESQESLNKAPSGSEFEVLRRSIEAQKEELKSLEDTRQLQRKLLQAYTTAFPSNTFPDRVVALNELTAFSDQKDKVERELQELAEVRSYADRNGRSEKEFSELKFAFKQYYPNGPEFTYDQAGAIERLMDIVATKISKNTVQAEINSAMRTQTGNEIKRLLGVEGTTLYLKDIRKLLEKEEARMQRLRTSIQMIRDLLKDNDQRTFGKLGELSETLQNHFLSLRQEQKIQFEYETAKKENQEASAFIRSNSDRVTKYGQAIETLRALTGDEASAHVAAFFNENFQEIVDIFKSIHTPKEFKSLRYIEDRLELVTVEGICRSISQISTGQRSALALAIFLSLNGKLTNGPDIILFDDPVAFIDDLNALSFLDHLRVHTLRSDRQIFFATANMRLAGLFEKKFGFLGEDDFRIFKLERI